MPLRIEIDRGRLADVCRRHGIRRLAFFGSVVRDDFRPGSDVDVLVEFDDDRPVDFFALHRIEQELSALAGGRAVDVVTYRALNHRIKARALADAEVQYAEG